MTEPVGRASDEAPPARPGLPFDVAEFAALHGLGVRARAVMEGTLSGVHGSPFQGTSVEFSEYRAYQPGDDLRRVDWRLYARCDRLYSKRFMHETNARCYFLVDTSGSMSYRGEGAWGSKLEGAAVAVAALGSLLLRQNDAVGLLTLPSAGESDDVTVLRPSQKGAQLGRLIGRLESLRATGDGRLAELLEVAARVIHRRSIVVVASDLLDPEEEAVADALRRLRYDGHDVSVVQVLDGDELELPFADASLFVDLESGRRMAVDPEAIRRDYLQRFAAFRERYEMLLTSAGVPHVLLRTDEHPSPVLAGLLAERRALG